VATLRHDHLVEVTATVLNVSCIGPLVQLAYEQSSQPACSNRIYELGSQADLRRRLTDVTP
jgi:hypothetical protein